MNSLFVLNFLEWSPLADGGYRVQDSISAFPHSPSTIWRMRQTSNLWAITPALKLSVTWGVGSRSKIRTQQSAQIFIVVGGNGISTVWEPFSSRRHSLLSQVKFHTGPFNIYFFFREIDPKFCSRKTEPTFPRQYFNLCFSLIKFLPGVIEKALLTALKEMFF